VISSRTSGASALLRDGENGCLFDLSNPRAFHQALRRTLSDPALRTRLAESGRELALATYDVRAVARQVKHLYQELIEVKHALRAAA
jgi:glycosyltransferase involved in cell wall biosynthesis